jgi:hypothetical protein
VKMSSSSPPGPDSLTGTGSSPSQAAAGGGGGASDEAILLGNISPVASLSRARKALDAYRLSEFGDDTPPAIHSPPNIIKKKLLTADQKEAKAEAEADADELPSRPQLIASYSSKPSTAKLDESEEDAISRLLGNSPRYVSAEKVPQSRYHDDDDAYFELNQSAPPPPYSSDQYFRTVSSEVSTFSVDY